MTDMSTQKGKSIHIYAPFVLFLVGLLIRYVHYDLSGFWLDEAGMAFRVQSLELVFKTHDGSPPAYAIVVYLLSLIFGASDSALRITSLVCGSLLAPAIFYFLRKNHTLWSAWLGGILACVNPVSYFYSHEFKPYSFLTLMVVLQVGSLVRVLYDEEEPGRATYIFAGVVTAVVVLTHQYGLLATCAAAILCLIRAQDLEENRRKNVFRLLGYTLVGTILVWVPTTWEHLFRSAHNQAAAAQSPYWSKYHPLEMFSLIQGYFFSSPTRRFDQVLVSVSAPLVSASMLALCATSKISNKDFFWAWHLFLSITFACMVQWVWPHYWARRYETAFMGVAIVVVVLAVSKIRFPKLRNGFALVLVLIFSWVQFESLAKPVPRSSSRNIAGVLSAWKVDATLITLQKGFDPLVLAPLVYYLGKSPIDLLALPTLEKQKFEYLGPSLFYRRETELKILQRKLTPERIAEFLDEQNYHRIGLVVSPQEAPPFNVLPGWKVERVQRFGSFRERLMMVVLLEKEGS